MSAPAREAGSEPGRSKVMVPLGELVVQLGRLGDLAQRLLAVHVPDRHGRCRGCTVPGTGLVQVGRLGDLAQRLLAVHVPDRHGRCRGCTVAGTGLPGAVWPCALHFYATAAAQLVAR